MKSYNSKNVINGTFGETWLNSNYVAENTGLQLKVAFNKSDVNQTGTLMTGKKITSASGTGTLKLNKVTSRMILALKDFVKSGKVPEFTIISNLKDPDALGAERVKVTGVTFDELTLADWEANKFGEESYPFTFTDYELIDVISKE
jgi:hypothetical protein